MSVPRGIPLGIPPSPEGTLNQAYPPHNGSGTRHTPLDSMTHTSENITFPKLRWRAVDMSYDEPLNIHKILIEKMSITLEGSYSVESDH